MISGGVFAKYRSWLKSPIPLPAVPAAAAGVLSYTPGD
jgi:hypothetical protein